MTDDEYLRRRSEMREAGDERRVRPLDFLAREHRFPWARDRRMVVDLEGRQVAYAASVELADLLVEAANELAERAGLLLVSEDHAPCPECQGDPEKRKTCATCRGTGKASGG